MKNITVTFDMNSECIRKFSDEELGLMAKEIIDLLDKEIIEKLREAAKEN